MAPVGEDALNPNLCEVGEILEIVIRLILLAAISSSKQFILKSQAVGGQTLEAFISTEAASLRCFDAANACDSG